MKSTPFVVLAVVLLIVFYFFFWREARAAGPTMQNDTESIALPTGVNDQGEEEVIYDNPFLIQQWAESSNDPYAEYLESLALSITPGENGTVIVSVGEESEGATSETFVETFGDSTAFSYTPPTPSSVGGSGTGGSLVISGSKLRQALAEKGILTLDVKGWDFDDTYFVDDSEYYAEYADDFSFSDVAVIAAAVVFRDQNIEEVSLNGTRLTITYRTKGWLLGFIPIHFTVRLAINAAGATDQERVTVAYPWYRFLTWVQVSPQALAANLNASIVGIQAAGLDTAEAQARLFTYVGATLREQSATDVTGL